MQPGSLTSVPSPVPIWGGGSRGQQQGEPLPPPHHLGSGFPKREALTTHRLGDGICKGRQGLGPGGLKGRRERETGKGTRDRERCRCARRKDQEDRIDTERQRIKKDRDTQKVTVWWEGRVRATREEVGRIKKGQERESGMCSLSRPETSASSCPIREPREPRSQTPMLPQSATSWVNQGWDQVGKEGKCPGGWRSPWGPQGL